MNMTERSTDELLDVVRVLLLVQGAILLVTAIEAAIWGAAFGAGGAPFLISAAVAAAVLIVRARLRPDRSGPARIAYFVEGAILLTLAVDTVLALIVAREAPPLVTIITRLVLPVAVIALLARSRATAPRANVLIAEGGA